jgi:SAM-dependent methyltransferase
LAALLLVAGCAKTGPGPSIADTPDSPFVTTPMPVVEEMLDLAKVTKDDLVYDLGSGDGRIVIAAAQRGARAVGVELDGKLVQDSRDRAFTQGVADRTRFVWGDVLKQDYRDATVVTLYLFPELNDKLAVKFQNELRPGSRVVSHRFPVAKWTPAQTLAPAGSQRPYVIYLYVMPPRSAYARPDFSRYSGPTRISRGFAPWPGPMIRSCSIMSMKRAAFG